MADSEEEITAARHPFQIEVLGGPLGAYEIDYKDGGTFVRIDMPGVPESEGVKIFKNKEIWTVNFTGKEQKSKHFPYEQSERIYAGGVSFKCDPNRIRMHMTIRDGVLNMFFSGVKGSLLFLPRKDNSIKVSMKSVLGKSSSSNPGKNSDETAKSEMDESSSEEKQSDEAEGIKEVTNVIVVKDQDHITVEDWSAGFLNVLNPFVQDSPTYGPGETPCTESSAEGSAKSESSEGSGESDEDYNAPFIHEPEVTLGAVTDFAQHRPPCDCGNCNQHGYYLKTCYTVDDFPEISRFKLQGPDGVCDKIVGEDEEGLLLYVRCDMPGLARNLFNLRAGERMIVAFGMPGPDEYYKQGGRTYWCIVQNHCPCCTFKNVDYDFCFGVLRMRCRISRTIPPPAAAAEIVSTVKSETCESSSGKPEESSEERAKSELDGSSSKEQQSNEAEGIKQEERAKSELDGSSSKEQQSNEAEGNKQEERAKSELDGSSPKEQQSNEAEGIKQGSEGIEILSEGTAKSDVGESPKEQLLIEAEGIKEGTEKSDVGESSSKEQQSNEAERIKQEESAKSELDGSSSKEQQSNEAEGIKQGSEGIEILSEGTAKSDVDESPKEQLLIEAEGIKEGTEKSDVGESSSKEQQSNEAERIKQEESAKSELDGSSSKEQQSNEAEGIKQGSEGIEILSEGTAKSDVDESPKEQLLIEAEGIKEGTEKSDVGESSSKEQQSNEAERIKQEESAKSELDGSSSKEQQSNEAEGIKQGSEGIEILSEGKAKSDVDESPKEQLLIEAEGIKEETTKSEVCESSCKEQQFIEAEGIKEGTAKSDVGESSSKEQLFIEAEGIKVLSEETAKSDVGESPSKDQLFIEAEGIKVSNVIIVKDQDQVTIEGVEARNFPAEMIALATYRRIRVSSEDNVVDQYAYETSINVRGHVFNGILYDQSPTTSSTETSSAVNSNSQLQQFH